VNQFVKPFNKLKGLADEQQNDSSCNP